MDLDSVPERIKELLCEEDSRRINEDQSCHIIENMKDEYDCRRIMKNRWIQDEKDEYDCRRIMKNRWIQDEKDEYDCRRIMKNRWIQDEKDEYDCRRIMKNRWIQYQKEDSRRINEDLRMKMLAQLTIGIDLHLQPGLANIEKQLKALNNKKSSLFEDLHARIVLDITELQKILIQDEYDCIRIIMENRWKRQDEKRRIEMKTLGILLFEIHVKISILLPLLELVSKVEDCLSSSLFKLILLLIIWCFLCGKKNLKRCLVLKYSDQSVKLILLWCSGDVEKHPGPSQHHQTDSISTQLRKVTNELCSKLLKRYLQITLKTPRMSWKCDTDFHLFDPTDGKKYSTTYESLDKQMMIYVLSYCCDRKLIAITDLRPMIDALKCPDYNRFLDLYNIQGFEKIDHRICRIDTFVDKTSWMSSVRKIGIHIDSVIFESWKITHGLECREVKSGEMTIEALKSINCILCKIAKDVDPEKQVQNLYQSIPCEWETCTDIPFHDPHNAKIRDIQTEVKYFQQLVQYCKKKRSIEKITPYQQEIDACETWIKDRDQSPKLTQAYLLRHETAKLKKDFQNLKANGMLNNDVIQDMLNDRGIELHVDGLSTEDTTSMTGKRRNASCSYRPRKKIRTGEEVTTIILNGEKLEIKTTGCTLDFTKLLKEKKIIEIKVDNKDETNQNNLKQNIGEDDISTSVNTSSEQTDTIANSDDCTPSTSDTIADAALNAWSTNYNTDVLKGLAFDLLGNDNLPDDSLTNDVIGQFPITDDLFNANADSINDFDVDAFLKFCDTY